MSDQAPPPPPPAGDRRSEKADAKAEKAREKAMRPWYKKKRFAIPLAMIILVVLIIALGGGETDDTDDVVADGTTTTETPTDDAEADGEDPDDEDDPTTTTEEPPTTTEPPPEPIVVEGTGDNVLPVDLPFPAYAVMSHSGTANFIVYINDAEGELAAGLANQIGDYTGERIVDVWEEAAFVEVNADGPWRIEFRPLETAPELDLDAGGSGTGDAVRRVNLDGAASVRMTHDGQANFIVLTYDSDAGLTGGIVNEIGEYEGTVMARNADVFDITADGNWTMVKQ